jgi:hypothetical protein
VAPETFRRHEASEEVDESPCASCTGSSFEGRIDMKRSVVIGLASAVMLALVGTAMVSADSNRQDMKARLSGFQEVPAISTQGSGSLRLKVNDAGTSISFELSYANLEGGAVSAAHIHFAQPGVNGAPIAWLCGGGGKPTCPAAPAKITGTIVATDIIDASAQGIAAGQLGEALRAMRAGVTYVNVHTAGFPSGEIRGLIGGKTGH